jgi:gliding motility-associated-like protein
MQFSINWDSTVFTFDHVEGFTIPGLDASGFGTPPSPDVKQGQLTVSWIDLTLQGVTVPDLSTIFRLCLKAKGASGTSSPITFSANPIDIEIATIDSVLVYGLVNGKGEIKASCETGCNVSYTLTGVGPSCPRESNGSLNLTVFEDCPESPTYLWNYNNATTEDLSDIGAGTYTVTITVGPNVVIASITLTDPPPLGVTGTVIDPDPSGSATGAINITVTGGTPPYTFKWSAPPPGPTTEDLTNIFAGVYTVTVTDSKGCTFIPDPYVVGADVSAAVTDVTCNGGSDGAINLSVSFGTGPYTFSWNTVPVKTTEDISNLTARIYCVTITDNGGSTRDTCFTVAQPELLVVTGTVVNDINENCQGAIDLNVVGGTLPYSYKWSAPPPGPTSQDITQLCAGQYCVTVTDGNGCTATKCFTVFAGGINVSLVATQYGNFQTSCAGICDGDITSVVAGGSGTITYAWSNGATTPDLTSLCAGTYTVTVTDASAQTSSATIVISSPVAFTLSYIKTSPSDYITSDGAIAVVVNGGVPPYTYHWTGPASGNTAALNNVPAGTYTVVVTDANGCEVRDSEQLIPDGDVPCYKAITVITPNSDGKNDYFIIACVFDLDNHLYIFNRLGGLVYETNNYQNTWIGVDQDNEPVPDGGYLWVLEVYRTDGSTQLIKGTVNVLRTAD